MHKHRYFLMNIKNSHYKVHNDQQRNTLCNILHLYININLKLDLVGGAIESSIAGVIFAFVVFPNATADVRARCTFRLAWIHSCS